MPDGRLASVAVTGSNIWTQIYTAPAGKTTVANINITNLGNTTGRVSLIATTGSYTSSGATGGTTSSLTGFTLQEVFDINANVETMVMTNISGSSTFISTVTQSYMLARHDTNLFGTFLGIMSSSFREVRVPGSASIQPFMPIAPISTSRKEHVSVGVRGMVMNTVYPRLTQSLARDYWYWQFQEPVSQPLPANVSGSYRRLKFINGLHFILTNSGSYAIRERDWQTFTLSAGEFNDVDYDPTTGTYVFVASSASLSTVFTSSVGTSSLTTPVFSHPSANGLYYTVDYVPQQNLWYVGRTDGIMSSSNLTSWASASISGAGVIVNSTNGNFLLTYLPTRDVNIYAPANSASVNVISYLSGSRWITTQPSGANARVTDAVELNNMFVVVAGSNIYYINPEAPPTQQVIPGPSLTPTYVTPSGQAAASNITLTKVAISASNNVTQSIVIRGGTNNLAAIIPPWNLLTTLPNSTSPLIRVSPRPFSYSSSFSIGPGNATGIVHEGMLVATSVPRVNKINGLFRVNGLQTSGSLVAIGRQNRIFDILSTVPYAPRTSRWNNNILSTNYTSTDLDTSAQLLGPAAYYTFGTSTPDPYASFLFAMNKGIPVAGNNPSYADRARLTYMSEAMGGPHTIDEHSHIIRYVQFPYYNHCPPSSASKHIAVAVIPKSVYSSSTFMSTITQNGMGVLTSSVLSLAVPSGYYSASGPEYPSTLTTPSASSGKYFLHTVSTSSGAPKDTIFDYLPFQLTSAWSDGGNTRFDLYEAIAVNRPYNHDTFVTFHSGSPVIGRTFNTAFSSTDPRRSSIQSYDLFTYFGVPTNTPYNIIPFEVGTPAVINVQGITAPSVDARYVSASGILPLLVSTNLTGSAQVLLFRQHNAPMNEYAVNYQPTYSVLSGSLTSSIIIANFNQPWRTVASGSDVTGNLIVSGGTTTPVNFLYSRTNGNALGIRGSATNPSTVFYYQAGAASFGDGQSPSPGINTSTTTNAANFAIADTPESRTTNNYIAANTKLRGIARGFYEVSGSTGVIIFVESGSGRVSVSTDTGYTWTVADTGLPTEVSTYVKLNDLSYRFFDQQMSASYTQNLLTYTLLTQTFDPEIYGNLEKWNVVSYVSSSTVPQLHSYVASDNGKVYRIIPGGTIIPAVTSSGPPESEYLEYSTALSGSGGVLLRKGEVIGENISLQVSSSVPVAVNIAGFEKSN